MRGDGVAVGDVGAVSCGARGRRDTSGGDDYRRAGRERDTGVVGGHCRTEQDASLEPRRHGIGVDYGTRIEYGGGGSYSAGEGGSHGMRGDGVAVGDVGAVFCGARGRRDTPGGDDGRGAKRERVAGVVAGLERTEQDAADEPRRHGIGFDDGTWIWHGVCCAYSAGEGGTHGMRGDGLAVCDVGAVSCGARRRRDTADGDDGRGAGWEFDAGLVGGHSRTEQDAADEPCWHGICINDGTRTGYGVGCIYNAGKGWVHGMRGHTLGVGDVGAVSCGARDSRDTSGGDDGRGAGGERDAGVVD